MPGPISADTLTEEQAAALTEAEAGSMPEYLTDIPTRLSGTISFVSGEPRKKVIT